MDWGLMNRKLYPRVSGRWDLQSRFQSFYPHRSSKQLIRVELQELLPEQTRAADQQDFVRVKLLSEGLHPGVFFYPVLKWLIMRSYKYPKQLTQCVE
jgi:hypothetical protein